MLRGEFESVGTASPDATRQEYERVLVETVERVGTSSVAAETGIDGERLTALVAGEAPDLSVEEATAVLATDPDRPDAETLLAEARDILLMGMSTAVLDVDAIASGLGGELEPKEIQQKVEGRYPMTLAEYALLHTHIEGEKR